MNKNQFAVRPASEPLRQKLLAEGLPPLAARVLSARNISGREDVAPKLAALPFPEFLPDIQKFCETAAEIIAKKQKICVVGDYDADGMCATALSVQCLRLMNADVIWRIPDRFRHGYGLHEQIAEEAAKSGAKMLLTVDNGVSANAAAARAKTLGMTVCITDHHLPPPELPDAACIINPMLAQNETGKNLSGTGVAFYAMAALRRHIGADIKLAGFLDLVALGTVADCMPMDKLNRTLVGNGLRILRAARRPGTAAMAAAPKTPRNTAGIGIRDISHFFAPRINAAGRFGRAELAVECLLAQNAAAARQAAAEMEELNNRRKGEVEKIMQQIGGMNITPPAVLFDENWAPGVLGIVAGNICDLYRRPAVIFCRHEELWRGSGRAPPGWDLHALAAAAAKRCGKDTVPRFGGHRRAVGISVRDPEAFREAFVEECRKAAPEISTLREVDALPPPEEITKEGVEYLEGVVWGGEFPRPLFAGDFKIVWQRKMGGGHVRMELDGGGWTLPALAFNRESVGEPVRAVFSLCRDKFNGKASAVIEELL